MSILNINSHITFCHVAHTLRITALALISAKRTARLIFASDLLTDHGGAVVDVSTQHLND